MSVLRAKANDANGVTGLAAGAELNGIKLAIHVQKALIFASQEAAERVIGESAEGSFQTRVDLLEKVATGGLGGDGCAWGAGLGRRRGWRTAGRFWLRKAVVQRLIKGTALGLGGRDWNGYAGLVERPLQTGSY